MWVNSIVGLNWQNINEKKKKNEVLDVMFVSSVTYWEQLVIVISNCQHTILCYTRSKSKNPTYHHCTKLSLIIKTKYYHTFVY